MITKREAVAWAVTVQRDRQNTHSANFIRLDVRRRRTRVRLVCTWVREAWTGRLSCRWQEVPSADRDDGGRPQRARIGDAHRMHPRTSSDRLPHNPAAARAAGDTAAAPAIRPFALTV
jgi:hypothetical protein